MNELSESDVARARLSSLLLADPGGARTDLPAGTSAGQIVRWFGAMQAQDLASGKWSFGVRLPGSLETTIDAAIESGEVLRTWPMRGTIHFVPPDDARWMLELTGVKALDGAARRREYLGLDLATVDTAASVLETTLRGGGKLTRAEAVALLTEVGISAAGQHGYHLLWYSSQIGVTCIGPNVGKEQTFVLLDEWAPQQRSFDREQALIELGFRYFRSHGPTTVKDFAGWTGLSMADSRAALAGNDGRLVRARFRGADVWMRQPIADAIADGSFARTAGAVVLPGFDEFLLGYKDRSVQVPDEHKNAIIPGGNGIFRSTVVIDGRAVGTWTRVRKKARIDVSMVPFEPFSVRQRSAAMKAFEHYGRYCGLPLAVV